MERYMEGFVCTIRNCLEIRSVCDMGQTRIGDDVTAIRSVLRDSHISLMSVSEFYFSQGGDWIGTSVLLLNLNPPFFFFSIAV